MTNTSFYFTAIVFCQDSEEKLVPVPQYLTEYESHAIKKIENNLSISFHALLLCGRNTYLYNTKELSGQANLQLRQIQKIGYKTHLVRAHPAVFLNFATC